MGIVALAAAVWFGRLAEVRWLEPLALPLVDPIGGALRLVAWWNGLPRAVRRSSFGPSIAFADVGLAVKEGGIGVSRFGDRHHDAAVPIPPLGGARGSPPRSKVSRPCSDRRCRRFGPAR